MKMLLYILTTLLFALILASLLSSQTPAGSRVVVPPTPGDCTSSASPAVCGAAAAGSVTVAAAATTKVVNTTAVTANSQIFIARDDSLGTKLSVTCNTATAMTEKKISARTAGTSFTITVAPTPATNPYCLSFTLFN